MSRPGDGRKLRGICLTTRLSLCVSVFNLTRRVAGRYGPGFQVDLGQRQIDILNTAPYTEYEFLTPRSLSRRLT